MRKLTAFVAVAALALPLSVHANTLGQKKVQKDQEARIVSEIDSAAKACGKNVAFSFDWPSFRDEDYEAKYSIHGYCAAPFEGMRLVCNDDLGKEAVQTRISKVVCKRGDERAAELSEDGTLTYTVDFKSSDNFTFMKQFLLDTL